MPYEFSGLYLFGSPLPAVDDDMVTTPGKAARARAGARDAEAVAPAEDDAAAPALPQS